MPFGQVVTVVGIAFGAFGLLLAVLGGRTLLADRRRRESWTTVPGRVVASQLQDGQYRCQVGYAYGGVQRTFWNRYTASGFGDPVGREVEVLVDPADPSEAVVGRGLAARGRVVGVVLLVVGLVFAVVGALVATGGALVAAHLPG